MLLSVWLERRFPTQSWIENRLAWLCPKDLVIAQEALAQAHPYRYMCGITTVRLTTHGRAATDCSSISYDCFSLAAI